MADIKDKLPKPPGEGDSKIGGVSHGVMSKSFGLQKKTLARVIGLEKRVDKIEADGQGGIDADKFSEINQGIAAINGNLSSIKEFIDADMLAQQQAADDKKKDDARAADSKKKLDAEKFLEQKQEQKLLKPAVKVAENTKSVFQRLFDALTGIFAGWLFDKGGKLITAWSEGDTEKFNEMKNQIIGALAVVGGIFAVANIGAIIAGMKLVVAGLKIGVPAILGLLANPWTWVVLGVGTGLYFGVKAIKRQITGGKEFEKVDKHLRAEAKESGIKMHFTGNASVLNDAGNVMWVDTYGEQGILGREHQDDDPLAADHRQRLTLEKESHREWIKKHMGEKKLEEMLAAKENYNKMMELKNTIKKEMRKKMKLDRKAWYKQTKDLEKKLRDEGKIGGKNWKKISLLNWADTSAGQWWTGKDKEWKGLKADIRVEYVKKLKEQFPEAFKGEEIVPKEFEAINEDDLRTLAEQRYQELDSSDYGSGGMKIDNGGDDTSVNNGNEAKGDGIEGTRTSVPMPNGILQPSKQASRTNNEQKLQSISSSTDDQPNIEVLPVMGQTQQSGPSEPLNRGSAAEIPSLLTSNSSNDYRYFYTHIYQQGTD